MCLFKKGAGFYFPPVDSAHFASLVPAMMPAPTTSPISPLMDIVPTAHVTDLSCCYPTLLEYSRQLCAVALSINLALLPLL
jgi:hypothetical protein